MKGWDQKLGQAEFAFNHSVNRSTGFFPFQIVYDFVSRSLLDLAPILDLKKVHSKAEDFIKQLQQVHEVMRQNLLKSTTKYKQ